MSVDSVPAALTPRQEEVKARFIEVRGTWSEAWEAVVRLDPDFLEAYLRFSAVPWRHGPLPPKVKEFIYIAIDANATHMYLPGVRQHIKAALDHGATGAEIMEVLELTATLGIHAMNVGMPVLAEVLSEMGRPTGTGTGRAAAGDQRGVHPGPGILALELGRHPAVRSRTAGRVPGVLWRAVARRQPRAQGEGIHLHRVRCRGDTPVPHWAENPRRERARLRSYPRRDHRGHGDRRCPGRARGNDLGAAARCGAGRAGSARAQPQAPE